MSVFDVPGNGVGEPLFEGEGRLVAQAAQFADVGAAAKCAAGVGSARPPSTRSAVAISCAINSFLSIQRQRPPELSNCRPFNLTTPNQSAAVPIPASYPADATEVLANSV